MKSFYSAGLLFDVLNCFGELSEDVSIHWLFHYVNLISMKLVLLVDSQEKIRQMQSHVFEQMFSIG